MSGRLASHAATLLVAIAAPFATIHGQSPAAPLDPARYLAGTVDTIAVTVEMQDRSVPVATAIYSLRLTTRAGSSAWERAYRWLGNDGSRTADTLWFDARTLAPIENHRHNGRQDGVTTFQKSSARTKSVPTGGVEEFADTTVAGRLYASGELEELMRSAPLAVGYAAAYTLYYGPPGQLAHPASFKVIRTESISGKDGRPVECWVVDAALSGGPSTFFLSKTDHRVVRLEDHEDPSGAFVFVR